MLPTAAILAQAHVQMVRLAPEHHRVAVPADQPCERELSYSHSPEK